MSADFPSPRRASIFLLIVAVNVGAYFIREFMRGETDTGRSAHMAEMIAWGASIAPLTLTGSPLRLLTSRFLHAGLLHLF